RLYQTLRYGSMSYSFPIANGSYTVKLKFSEIYFTSSSQRVFNVAINSSTVLSNFDINAAAGGSYIALDRSFPISVTTGQVQITFTNVVNNAEVDAIEIIPADLTPPTTSITSPANGATVSSTVTIQASASDNIAVTKVEFYVDS